MFYTTVEPISRVLMGILSGSGLAAGNDAERSVR